MDAIPAAWLRRNVFQPWEGGLCGLVMYRATVVGDLDPEHQQFAMDSRRSPQEIPPAHLSDQIAKIAVGSNAMAITITATAKKVQSTRPPEPHVFHAGLSRFSNVRLAFLFDRISGTQQFPRIVRLGPPLSA